MLQTVIFRRPSPSLFAFDLSHWPSNKLNLQRYDRDGDEDGSQAKLKPAEFPFWFVHYWLLHVGSQRGGQGFSVVKFTDR